MILPRVTRGDEVVYKTFYDPANALRELQMTRILSTAMIECMTNYSQDLRHVVVFERATPLPELEPSLRTGLDVFSGLMSCLSFLHDVFNVSHNAITPEHVVMDQDDEWKLIDSKHITKLGSPQGLYHGMRGGFACADALTGGQRVEERHAVYSAAVTSLWAIRRAHSFINLKDPVYVTGKALIEAGNLKTVRSVWELRDEELLLLPHLVGGFQKESLDRLAETTRAAGLLLPAPTTDLTTATAPTALVPAVVPVVKAVPVSENSTPVATDRPTSLKRKAPEPPSEALALRRQRRMRA